MQHWKSPGYLQSLMIEIEGKVNILPISILIDYGASVSYINDNLIERYMLVSIKLSKHMMV